MALAGLLIGLGAISCEQSPPHSEVETLRSKADLTVIAELGIRSDDGLGVLRRPMDAIFSGDEVLVLDTSAPWIRVFNREGHFLRAMVRRGEGPGEVVLPYSLTAARDGGFVVAHSRGIERLDREGESVLAAPSAGRLWVRGAVEACGREIFALAARPGEIDGPGLLLRVESDGTLGDTLAILDPLRPKSQLRRRASFLERIGERILLYTEELNRPRLLEFGCDGHITREIKVDSLGEPERAELGPDGRIAVTWPQPPIPGGVATVNDRVLWVTLAVRESMDSTTVITAFDADGSSQSVTIEGWLQLFDSEEGGLLLFGNADDLYPSVLLVDGNALLRLIDQQSVPLSRGNP